MGTVYHWATEEELDIEHQMFWTLLPTLESDVQGILTRQNSSWVWSIPPEKQRQNLNHTPSFSLG